MPKTITLSDAMITGMAIDPNDKRFLVSYTMTNEDRTISQPGNLVFIGDIPKDANGAELPEETTWVKMTPKVKEAYDTLMKFIENKVRDEVK